MKHLCNDCVKADKTCPIYGDVDYVGNCVEYRSNMHWVGEILNKQKVSNIDLAAINGEGGSDGN